MKTDTMTLRLPSEVKEQLGVVAKHTRRSKSFLAGEAVASYVAREMAIIERIQRGIDDMEAGRVVPHEQAKPRIRKTLAASKNAT